MSRTSAAAPPLIVLVDDGDGTAEAQARQLKAAGTHNFVILAGGEAILARHGQAGLQRTASSARLGPANAPGQGGK